MAKIVIAGTRDFCDTLAPVFEGAKIMTSQIVARGKVDGIIQHAKQRPETRVVVLEHESFLEDFVLRVQALRAAGLVVVLVIRQKTDNPIVEEKKYVNGTLGVISCISRSSMFQQRVLVAACNQAGIEPPETSALHGLAAGSQVVPRAAPEERLPPPLTMAPGNMPGSGDEVAVFMQNFTRLQGVYERKVAEFDAEMARRVAELVSIETQLQDCRSRMDGVLDLMKRTRKALVHRSRRRDVVDTSKESKPTAKPAREKQTLKIGKKQIQFAGMESLLMVRLIAASGKRLTRAELVGNGEAGNFPSIQSLSLTFHRATQRLKRDYPKAAEQLTYESGAGYKFDMTGL